MPSLINGPGITSIDGVAVAAPHFDENKPLRDQPVVINTVAGATAIQRALEFVECRTLVPDRAVLELTWQTSTAAYNAEFPAVELLLAALDVTALEGDAATPPAAEDGAVPPMATPVAGFLGG